MNNTLFLTLGTTTEHFLIRLYAWNCVSVCGRYSQNRNFLNARIHRIFIQNFFLPVAARVLFLCLFRSFCHFHKCKNSLLPLCCRSDSLSFGHAKRDSLFLFFFFCFALAKFVLSLLIRLARSTSIKYTAFFSIAYNSFYSLLLFFTWKTKTQNLFILQRISVEHKTKIGKTNANNKLIFDHKTKLPRWNWKQTMKNKIW